MQNLERRIAALQAKLTPNSGATENEKEIAQRILEAYRKQGHNVDIDKVEWREFPFRGGSRNTEKSEFLGIILRNLYNEAELAGRRVLDDAAYNYEIEMTLAEYIEVKERFTFYWPHYQREKKKAESIFLRAYIGKNNLWTKPEDKEEEDRPLTEEQRKQHLAARMLQEHIDRAEYNVRITAPKQ